MRIYLAILATAWAASAVSAQTALQQMPENTLPCDAFKKTPRGSWHVDGPITFDVGKIKGLALKNANIRPGVVNVGGIDLYKLIETKCAPPGTKPSNSSR